MLLLISDANILIDMEAGGLMATLFQLPMTFGGCCVSCEFFIPGANCKIERCRDFPSRRDNKRGGEERISPAKNA